MDNQSAQDPNYQNTSTQTPADTASEQIVSSAPHKEHAPVTEHVRISDPVESQPEIEAELREAGVEAKHDEARLDLTREQQNAGVSHSPQTAPVNPHVEAPKAEFPMQYEFATEESKKGSVWNSLRWLATLVVKQMKIKEGTGDK